MKLQDAERRFELVGSPHMQRILGHGRRVVEGRTLADGHIPSADQRDNKVTISLQSLVL